MELIEEGFKRLEIGIIPNDWNVKLLSEISTITRLAGYEYTTMWSESIFGEIIALRGFNIGKNKIIEREFVRISNELSWKLKRSRLFKNDIIYPCVGSIGNAVVIEENDKYHIQQNIAKITPNITLVFPLYLSYYLMSSHGLNEINKFNGSSSQPNILVGSLRNYTIILPPFEEQITNSLKVFDELIISLEKLIQKKRQIKQGVIQELMKPKDGWKFKMLGEIAEMSSGGTPLTSVASYYNGEIPWVVIADITKAGKYISSTEKNISVEGLNNSSARLFKSGVLLFAMYASIGKCTISKVDATCNQAILGIIPKPSIDTEFLYYFLSFNEKKHSSMGQTGTQSNLNKEMVMNLSIPHPTLEEQKRITKTLSDIDEELNILDQKLQKAKSIKLGMMQNLLTGKIRLV